MSDLIRAENLSVVLGGRTVLQGITFSVQSSEFAGVVGPNGAGKNTLLRAILGLTPISGGELLVFSSRLGSRRPWR